MRQIFQDPATEAILLIDATNAFNSLNRRAALHNISILCPALAHILINTYRNSVRLIVQGNGEILSTEGTTQGDPLAMAMYALATIPLVQQLKASCPDVHQVWFADDATSASSCSNLKAWWDDLSSRGPAFGYFPNASKSYLVVKEEHEASARQLFMDTDVQITTDGKQHLGAAIGSKSFTEEYVCRKVQEWVTEIKRLAEVARSQPHAAFSAFTHGLSSRRLYLMRTIPDICDLLLPLENEIHQSFIPALTGRPPCSKVERDLLSLPARLGGLGIVNPTNQSKHAFDASVRLTGPLAALIASQELYQAVDQESSRSLKKTIRSENRRRQDIFAKDLYPHLTPDQKRSVDLTSQKGASSWLIALPLSEHGFFLNKGEFRDEICLRYNWELKNTPTHCGFGNIYSTDYAMICHTGGFPTRRHNEIRDITATLLTDVCHNVSIEPLLQPLSGESLHYRTSNVEDDARLDIRARGFWSNAQDAFFDVRVFHPNASSNYSTNLMSVFRRHEQAKKREYGERVREIEHGVFTPLVLSTTGSLGNEATVFYKRLADLLSIKQQKHYSVVMCWLRCHLGLAILRSAITCMRGSRSSRHRPTRDPNIPLAASEGLLT